MRAENRDRKRGREGLRKMRRSGVGFHMNDPVLLRYSERAISRGNAINIPCWSKR